MCHRHLPLLGVEDLHEAGHMRALEFGRQMDVHVEQADGVLHASTASPTTGWRMDLMPTLLIGRLRVSWVLCTSGMVVWFMRFAIN